MIPRRLFLMAGLASLIAPMARAAEFEITLTAAEWKKRLSPARYAVLREHATERAFSNSLMGESSDLLAESRRGRYHCAGCNLPVYGSDAKYDSKTGWPSFWEALPDAVGYAEDRTLFARRTEVHCRRCGGHLGHVFDDGPKPTGKRHCINGLALAFVAA
ncbi:MAG: peptide-methionine (R)-S-oxide reductase MsrB [Pseudorhodobacter sp.]